MDKQIRNIVLIILGSLVVVGIGLYFLFQFSTPTTPPVSADGKTVEGVLTLQQLADKTGCTLPATGSSLDDFAKCIKASGATFYGAFWCPHCKDEKALFGTSVQYLPYVECSTPDGNGQLQVCIDKNIQVYPTWVFK